MHSSDRLHALDAVRAFALILGIFFHAALSFLPNMDQQSEFVWLISDSSSSYVLAAFVGITHLFRMSLFFFIAGFFAHLVYHRKGPTKFLRDRSTRIALPFVVGWCVITPMLAAAWRWGQSKTNTLPFSGAFFGPDTSAWSFDHFPLAHLWFLYYLLIIYLLVVGGRHLFADRLDRNGTLRRNIDSWLKRAMEKRLAPLVFAIPVGLAALVSSASLMTGIPTPDHSLVPEIIPLVNYSVAFVGGWVVHRNIALLGALTSTFKSAFGFGFLAWLLTGAAISIERFMPDLMPMTARFLTGFALTVTAWYLLFGIVGYALKRFAHPSARIRYAADASYWLYLMHLPLVAALQVWVAYWPLHWSIKYPFIVAIALTLLLLSYHYLVRFTFIGAVLNGRKHARSTAEHAQPPLSERDSDAKTVTQ